MSDPTLPVWKSHNAVSSRRNENGMAIDVRFGTARCMISHLGSVVLSALLATSALSQSSKLSNVDLCDGKDRSSGELSDHWVYGTDKVGSKWRASTSKRIQQPRQRFQWHGAIRSDCQSGITANRSSSTRISPSRTIIEAWPSKRRAITAARQVILMQRLKSDSELLPNAFVNRGGVVRQ